MNKFSLRLGPLPFLTIGAGLVVLGVLFLNHIVNNLWPIDVSSIGLVRATALDQAEPTALLYAANKEIILAFLGGLLIVVTGLMLPVAQLLNIRFSRTGSASPFVVLRQAMWGAIGVVFCTWLQMNRTLSLGVALLVAGVFVTIEVLLQVRTKVAEITDL